ncbi:chromosome segregation protein SMC [Ornithinibacillus halophilus]|uniref:Chromosome partition protein Smc n=1 Tax=Ornithinibacillus halophilus TaxID=930117 RepID=A0A1M5C7X2_9BACI|nr:chromosome segregation protein SMC [Ornithinibacillus halophilus]SHF50849.1 condensin subunit Smc [Ornithinibacillus halophilus]
MFLKRLESVGFKSFAERINVEFVPGVTAVVGPNGSGKSNITDAIRWVLGEQSAKSLRGSKMEDIIFQGSDSRRALNVAEVTLVLDNQDEALPLDYEEVSVTRRVYRSGESEFYINKQSCRLKDIIDLFMDSGLGKEAFSIISQGKVEEILSSKAEERRTIFEEAAGVLKYKQRKKKAEYKLAETQENLNRIEDIIYEIEQQIGPLKDQADTAKTFIEKKELLKEKEIALLITEIEKLHKEWQGLLEELDKEKMSEIQLKTSIQQKEAKLETERQEINELDKAIEELQANLLSTTQLLEQHEGKKQVYNERFKHFEENKQKLEQQKEETTSKLNQTRLDLKDENEKLALLQSQRQETNQKLQEIEHILTNQQENIAEQIEELKADYIEVLNQQAAYKNEKHSIRQQLEQVTHKKDRQLEKFQDLIIQRDEYEQRKAAKKKELEEEEQQYDQVYLRQQQLKTELEQARSQHQESQTKLYQGYQYIEKLKSKKEMLEEMKEDFQGFFHGVKSILKAREDSLLQDIYGAVIELVDVPKEYITAIETVLGGQAQHIVVENDAAARAAINWLKKTNSGRATFLPLQSIQPRFVPSDVLSMVENHPGYVGIAANLIGVSEQYKKAIHHLMGHVIIAKTLKDANDIARQVMRRYRIVTLDGDVVNPGGSMSGGAQKKTNQSLFTREKDLQELTEKLTDFQEKALLFEKNVENQKQLITEKENALQDIEGTLHVIQEKVQQAKEEYNEVSLKLSSLSDNLTLYDQDKQQFETDQEKLKARDRELESKLHSIENELQSLQSEIDKLTEQQSEFQANQEQLQQDFHQYQVQLAEQDERWKNQREKSKAIERQVTDLQEELDGYTKELNDLLSINENNETQEEIEESIQRTKEDKERLVKEIQQKRSTRSEKTQRMQDEERELKEENKQHQVLQEKVQQKEVKANRLDVELENRLTKLQTEYTITFEKAMQLYEKVEDINLAKEDVRQIKLSIERLGTVNLGAIDEYERISERYTFLSEQKDDLVEAKQTLFEVIAEMDQEMEKLFDHTFSQIKAEFSVVFKELFGGGRAELKLTDPKNLLDTGVDIIAQPPGKKLQHLGLLSGGERALTAIALLFAILRVRPVPFCVLDEVEAALDEANVARFAKYVKMYSKNTQFIVITHRKGTMEEADVLYGVTMQESGVSRLVSVRLEDTKELIET